MIKQDLRLFFGSFFITLLLAGWITAFIMVDFSSSRYGNNDSAPALRLVQTDELHYTVDLLGRQYTLYLEQLNQAEAWRKAHASLVTPRKVLVLEQAYGLLVYGWKKFSQMYKEYQYQQNVANEPKS